MIKRLSRVCYSFLKMPVFQSKLSYFYNGIRVFRVYPEYKFIKIFGLIPSPCFNLYRRYFVIFLNSFTIQAFLKKNICNLQADSKIRWVPICNLSVNIQCLSYQAFLRIQFSRKQVVLSCIPYKPPFTIKIAEPDIYIFT